MSGNFEPTTLISNHDELLFSLPSSFQFEYKKLKPYQSQGKTKLTIINSKKNDEIFRSSHCDDSILSEIMIKIKKTKEEDIKNLVYFIYLISRHNISKNDKNIENYMKSAISDFSEKEKKELEMIKNKTKRNYSSSGIESHYSGKKFKNSTLNDYFKK